MPKTRTGTFTQSQMDEIRSQPGNVVYEYEYDKVDHVKSMSEVKSTITDLRKAYLHLRNTREDLCDKACRRVLLENPKFANFQKSHPSIFSNCTSREADQRLFEVMFAQINLREQVELGKVTQDEASQMMQAMVLEKCKTGESYSQWSNRQKK